MAIQASVGLGMEELRDDTFTVSHLVKSHGMSTIPNPPSVLWPNYTLPPSRNLSCTYVDVGTPDGSVGRARISSGRRRLVCV